MTRTFSHPWWKRLIIVDEDGIREERRGRPFASIRWEEVTYLGRYEVRGERSKRIRIVLMEGEGKELARYAREIWKQRCPERWRNCQERAWRGEDRAFYLWIPLLNLAPIIVFYVFLWWWDAPMPDSLQPTIQQMHRVSIVTVAVVVGMEIWYLCQRRKKRKSRELLLVGN